MHTEPGRGEWLWRIGCVLLALAVPAVVGYEVYFQWHAPGLDFALNIHTGQVLEVPPDSLGNYAGLMPGDVILTIDGRPYTGWQDLTIVNHQIEVRRGEQLLALELPVVRSARVHLAALATAVTVALVFWGAGGLLLVRRFQQREVRLLFLLAQACAVLVLFPLAHPAPALVPVRGLRLSNAGFHLAAPLLLHLYLSFPVQLGTPAQRRWWLAAAYGVAALAAALWFSNSPLASWGWLLIIGEIVTAVAILVYVYLRRATPDGRRRVRLVMFGNLVAAGPPLLFYVLPELAGARPPMPEWLVGLCLVCAPLAYLYATARHNLFGIDRLLNRAAVYTLLSLAILALYAGPLLLIYRFLPSDILLQVFVIAGLTLGVGLTFDWTRGQVQRRVDRLFYGGWYDYPGVIETISDALARTLERQQLTEVLARRVPALMQLQHADLWIGEQPQAADLSGFQSPNLQFPLVFQDQPRGHWTVGPRRDGDAFTAADRRILATLAREAEIALGNVLLVETLRGQLDELRASRESLAQAQRQLLRSREEERARLARELHDGPIQTLVGLNMQLGLLAGNKRQGFGEQGSGDRRQREGDAPGDATLTDALAEMRGEVRALLAELRQVCAELRPPMLDTLGLGAALRALADEWSEQSGVAVQLDLPSDSAMSLPGETSVNLYRVVQEALANIARHAAAQRVTIRLAWEDSRWALAIQDDGRGFDVPAALHDLATQGHFGLVGMQERVELIGGEWAIASLPGQGACVRVLWQRQPQIENSFVVPTQYPSTDPRS